MRFKRKPISAGIEDFPDLYIRKWSIPELFELKKLFSEIKTIEDLSEVGIRRVVALSLADCNGERVIPDGSESDADGLGLDALKIVNLAMVHNGMTAEAKNDSASQSGS